MVQSSIVAAYAEARQLRESLAATSEHQAYGWATATCGRVEAYRGKSVAAQELLAEAFGRLFLADDKYGQALVAACLAIPVTQTDLTRGMQLINSALTSDLDFNVADRAYLHGIAASCYYARHDFHQALIHLNELVKLEGIRGDDRAIAKALSNLSITVFQLGENELARDALLRALRPEIGARRWCQSIADWMTSVTREVSQQKYLPSSAILLTGNIGHCMTILRRDLREQGKPNWQQFAYSGHVNAPHDR